jgi:hypothetical protein
MTSLLEFRSPSWRVGHCVEILARRSLESSRNKRKVSGTTIAVINVMRRFGLVLMMLVLIWPMVRDCCLSVTHSLPCHGSKHTEDVACASNQQAIAEAKAALTAKYFAGYRLPIADCSYSGALAHVRSVVDATAAGSAPTTDIYLRTGALLI